MQPIPSLHSWIGLVTMCKYYGWLDQVVDLCQRLSRASRAYVRSHHRKALSLAVRVSRFHPQSGGWPDHLACKQLVKTGNGRRAQKATKNVFQLRDCVARAWRRSPPETSLQAVCARACRYYEELASQQRRGFCQVCVLLVARAQCPLPGEVEQRCHRYDEFGVLEQLVVVLTLNYLDDDDARDLQQAAAVATLLRAVHSYAFAERNAYLEYVEHTQAGAEASGKTAQQRSK